MEVLAGSMPMSRSTPSFLKLGSRGVICENAPTFRRIYYKVSSLSLAQKEKIEAQGLIPLQTVTGAVGKCSMLKQTGLMSLTRCYRERDRSLI